MSFGAIKKTFSSGAALQDYILSHAGPGTLTIVPHQRLAHQIWDRQRRLALESSSPAWEPLPVCTLQTWWSELFQGLWPQESLAPLLVRLARWRQALQAAPAPSGPTPELTWAQTLDETHILLCRYGLPIKERGPDDSSLVTWRRKVTEKYSHLLRQENWLSPGDLPSYLTQALKEGKVKLPEKVIIACLENPAPLEELWLQEVDRRTHLLRLQVSGDQKNIQDAVSLPDPQQEMHWVAAKLVELASKQAEPLHRLAVTAMDMKKTYAPQLRRIFKEILGPPDFEKCWAYNFSQGPSLSETHLFEAALLPLRFVADGQRREDLISLLLSPYYEKLKVQGQPLAKWDQVFRERRVDQGWEHLRETVKRLPDFESEAEVLAQLDRIWNCLKKSPAAADEWCRRLKTIWQELGFPYGLADGEPEVWLHLTELLAQIENALESEKVETGEFLEWLKIGARRMILAGPGIQTAGIQVLGLLEMRGLDFSHVFCLGMNSGVLPAPPRPLPLLSAWEKRQVLGGTYQSQHRFAAELYAGLLGTASGITFTRPQIVDQEERVSTPLYLGAWSQTEMAVLTTAHPAWIRSPAVRAAFQAGEFPTLPGYADYPLCLPVPSEISLSQISSALGCPCRFLLEHRLKIKELPEIEGGLDPRERGRLLHTVLASFTGDFSKILDQDLDWNHKRAWELLKEEVHKVMAPLAFDLHWQAEADRWLGDAGLLWEWLRRERDLFESGWRWLEMELPFQELCGQEWPFAIKGRIDRLDYHAESASLMIWDYKSGEIPKKSQVLENLEEPQLACYLMAVEQGRMPIDQAGASLRAGIIGLKSTRPQHLKHEDFKASDETWKEAAAAFAQRVAALGQRFTEGDFRPDPNPAPAGKTKGICKYCPYSLICGFIPAPAPVEEDEGQ